MVFKPRRFHGEPPVVPDGAPATASLETRVAEALGANDSFGTEGLKVVASGGEIFLFGDLGTRGEIDRAIEAVMAVPGVEKVTVRMHTGETP